MQFAGGIHSNSYKSKLLNVTDQQLISMLGSSQFYYIKDGNYISTTNGNTALWQLYVNSENKIYNKFNGSDTAFWNDASINQDEVLNVDIVQNAENILGYNCDELIFSCRSGLQKYYFSSVLGVQSSLFSRHKFGNWFEFISRSNALPLKVVIENAQFTMESVATEIKQMPLEGSKFVLPVGTSVAKWPN